jgi:hypothetical protein
MLRAAMDAGDQGHSIVQVVLYSALHVPQVYSEPYSYYVQPTKVNQANTRNRPVLGWESYDSSANYVEPGW